MEPPAPVIITTAPLMQREISSVSSVTGSLPRRSSIFTGRIWLMVTLPSMSEPIPGMVRMLAPLAWQRSRIWRMSFPLAEGMATTTSSTPWARTRSATRAMGPSTVTPWMRSRCLAGLSSTKPTTSNFAEWVLWISRTSISPASPAPTTRIFLRVSAGSRALVRMVSRVARMARRMPPTAMRASSQSMTKTERGSHCGPMKIA